MNIENHPIFKEVQTAYADCNLLQEAWNNPALDNSESEDKYMNMRNLSFRASRAVSVAEAVAIMDKVCSGYNSFEPSLIALLPDDCMVTLAREGSVCLYVQPGTKPLPSIRELKADEYRYGQTTTHGGFAGELRIWWD